MPRLGPITGRDPIEIDGERAGEVDYGIQVRVSPGGGSKSADGWIRATPAQLFKAFQSKQHSILKTPDGDIAFSVVHAQMTGDGAQRASIKVSGPVPGY